MRFSTFLESASSRPRNLSRRALSATIALICVFLAYFPQLDSIKALSVEVKLRGSIGRAEDLIARIKKLSILSARSSLASTTDRNVRNQILLQLEEAEVPKEERLVVATPFIKEECVKLLDDYNNFIKPPPIDFSDEIAHTKQIKSLGNYYIPDPNVLGSDAHKFTNIMMDWMKTKDKIAQPEISQIDLDKEKDKLITKAKTMIDNVSLDDL